MQKLVSVEKSKLLKSIQDNIWYKLSREMLRIIEIQQKIVMTKICLKTISITKQL